MRLVSFSSVKWILCTESSRVSILDSSLSTLDSSLSTLDSSLSILDSSLSILDSSLATSERSSTIWDFSIVTSDFNPVTSDFSSFTSKRSSFIPTCKVITFWLMLRRTSFNSGSIMGNTPPFRKIHFRYEILFRYTISQPKYKVYSIFIKVWNIKRKQNSFSDWNKDFSDVQTSIFHSWRKSNCFL